MGLTYSSTKKSSLKTLFEIERTDEQFVIALAGNPNTGKSTVFNTLTGLRHQAYGNGPEKRSRMQEESLKQECMTMS